MLPTSNINRWKYKGISGCAAKAGLRLTKVLPAKVSSPDERMDFQSLRAALFEGGSARKFPHHHSFDLLERDVCNLQGKAPFMVPFIHSSQMRASYGSTIAFPVHCMPDPTKCDIEHGPYWRKIPYARGGSSKHARSLWEQSLYDVCYLRPYYLWAHPSSPKSKRHYCTVMTPDRKGFESFAGSCAC